MIDLPDDAQKVLKAQQPDLSMASWAIRFAASHDNVMMVLSGMSNMEQMQDNAYGYLPHAGEGREPG